MGTMAYKAISEICLL